MRWPGSTRNLAAAGVHDADGEVWLQTLPRMFGYAFKPVSFWFAQRADGSLAAIVAEVHNTFGERHSYVLQGEGVAFGRTLAAPSACTSRPSSTWGGYRFRFMRRDEAEGVRPVSRVELHAPDGSPRLLTSPPATPRR